MKKWWAHACAVLSVARSTFGYQSRLAVRDASAVGAMRGVVARIVPGPHDAHRQDPH